MAHHEAGQLAAAQAGYRAVLARDPACVEALHYCGQLAFQVAQYPSAAELMGRAAALAPDDPVLLGNLGETLRQLHRLDEALARFRRSLALKPGDPIVCNNLGNALTTLGRYDEAVACYRQALAARPGYANAHNNLGNLHRQRRAFAEAEACFRRALELAPRFVEALNNLGTVLFVLGRLDEATDAFERALALRPDADLWNNLGGVLARCGRADDALAAFRRAVALAPQRADLHSNLVFALNYCPAETPESLRAEQRRWHERHGRPHAAAAAVPHTNDRSPERRLRIGYVSPDFRDHVVGRNLLPLFRHHARAAFEIVCYAHVPQPDAVTAEFRRLADGWRDIAPLSDGQLAATIRADGIDVLVDLALHTAKNRLLAFARRPAPVQVSFAGYPGGTGLETMDAHLTDPFLEPPGDAPETGPDMPFRLPHSFWCYAPAGPEPDVGPLPAATLGHVTFGCLNNLAKINPPVIRLWCDVLRALPDARFALLSPAGRHRRDLLAAFAAGGVTEDRIHVVEHRPLHGYLGAYRGIDIALDTFPYNGHTTSLDAFGMGVPVVTLVGVTPVARAGWSQLSNLGLPELAATTPADFVRIVVALARDLPRLAALRAGLRARLERTPLADAAGFARGIEAAYRTLWRRWAEKFSG
jgi:predicted O-linked N-acetylglucosamine transferase (SPINDLY family)